MVPDEPNTPEQPAGKRGSKLGTAVALVGIGLAAVGGWTVAKSASEKIDDLSSDEFAECVDELSRPAEKGDPFDYAVLSVHRTHELSETDAREVV